ncbi:MAG: DUF1043 family protein [Pseudomonadota bacterium]
MSDLITNIWVVALISVLLGVGLGVLIARVFARDSGGRTAADVQAELDQYKEEVGQHFTTTSELFRDLTEKYRDVYNHLASGAQSLGEDAMDQTRIEFTPSNAVTAEDSIDHTDQTEAASTDTDRSGDDPPLGAG